MADLWMALVVTSGICGVLGYGYAKCTGRSPFVWAAIGILLNLLGMAIICRRRVRS